MTSPFSVTAPVVPVDVGDHVLRDGRGGPEEFAGLAVEGVDDAGLAGHAGHHPADLARPQPRVDPAHRVGVGRDRGVEQHPLEGVVEVPVVVQVLVVPDDLAGVGVEGEGRVVVQVREVGAAEHELRGRRGDRRAGVDQVQLGVVAGGHPAPDVLAVGVGHPAPRLVARLAGGRGGAPPPQLGPGQGVVGSDDAGLGSTRRAAAPSRDHLPAGDDRPRAVGRGVGAVVEDTGLPHQLAGHRVEGEGEVVGAGVDDQPVVDREVAVGDGEPADVLVDVRGQIAPVLPHEVAARGVDGLDDIAGGSTCRGPRHRRAGCPAGCRGSGPGSRPSADRRRSTGRSGRGGCSPRRPGSAATSASLPAPGPGAWRR